MANFARGLRDGTSVAVLALVLGTPLAVRAAGLPSHGQYVSGQGSINKANRSLTVKQSSTTGIIDWNRFSVGAKNGVSFDNGSGATLNRVTGGNLSRIAGSLHASGSLYLMNSSGVIVSGTGRVVTGGSFIASSGNIGNDAFDGGRHKVLDARAAVINRGAIIAGKLLNVTADTGIVLTPQAQQDQEARNRQDKEGAEHGDAVGRRTGNHGLAVTGPAVIVKFPTVILGTE
jgi:filamentous hemagglutinin family protein